MNSLNAVVLSVFLLLPQPSFAVYPANAGVNPYLIPASRTRNYFVSSVSSSSAAKQAGPSLIKTRVDVLRLINAERARVGNPPLKLNTMLDLAAQKHAIDMAQRRYFSHNTPEGKKLQDRMRLVGYLAPPCNCAAKFSYAENIAKGHRTPAEVVAAWMKSPIHSSNILNREFKDVGLGYAGGMWVQNFGGIAVRQQ